MEFMHESMRERKVKNKRMPIYEAKTIAGDSKEAMLS